MTTRATNVIAIDIIKVKPEYERGSKLINPKPKKPCVWMDRWEMNYLKGREEEEEE